MENASKLPRRVTLRLTPYQARKLHELRQLADGSLRTTTDVFMDGLRRLIEEHDAKETGGILGAEAEAPSVASSR